MLLLKHYIQLLRIVRGHSSPSTGDQGRRESVRESDFKNEDAVQWEDQSLISSKNILWFASA